MQPGARQVARQKEPDQFASRLKRLAERRNALPLTPWLTQQMNWQRRHRPAQALGDRCDRRFGGAKLSARISNRRRDTTNRENLSIPGGANSCHACDDIVHHGFGWRCRHRCPTIQPNAQDEARANSSIASAQPRGSAEGARPRMRTESSFTIPRSSVRIIETEPTLARSKNAIMPI